MESEKNVTTDPSANAAGRSKSEDSHVETILFVECGT